ncbi:MAG: hypothetical protein U0Q15_00355 [Kineosporiaceae bacterium]
MTGGFGPADVLAGLRAGLGDALTEAGFDAVGVGSRLSWTWPGPPSLTLHALVMEHPDDAPHGQSFTLALGVGDAEATRIGLLMSAEQTEQVRARERAVLQGLPDNDVTGYRLGLLERTGADLRPRDQWLTAGGDADVAQWLGLVAPWLAGWAQDAGAAAAAVDALRRAASATSSSAQG